VGDFTFREDRLAVFRREVAGTLVSPLSESLVFSGIGSSRGSALTRTAAEIDERPPRREVDDLEELLGFPGERVREVGIGELVVGCSSGLSSAETTCSVSFRLVEEAAGLDADLRVRDLAIGLVSSSSSSSCTSSSSCDGRARFDGWSSFPSSFSSSEVAWCDMLFNLEDTRDTGAALDDGRRVVREGGLPGTSWPSLSALSPLDRFLLEFGAGLGAGGLFSGSTDCLAEERVERRGGMSIWVKACC